MKSRRRRLLGKLRRRRAPYAVLFGLAIVVLLTGAVSTFRVIGASALRTMAADSAAASMGLWPGDSQDVSRPNVPIVAGTVHGALATRRR